MDIEGTGEYVPFVTEFNAHVEHYNNLVHEHRGRLHVKIDISSAEINPVAIQSYTGKPISVIPVVKISKEEKDGKVKIVELTFSKDFTVGYKNNIAIGTATLVITGIGKYSGEIVTTFNIV
jgi:lactocepin